MHKPTMANLVGSLLVFFLVSGSSVMAQWNIPKCEDIVDDIIFCGVFLVGLTDDPPKECCNAVKQINAVAKRQGQQRVCMCVENIVKGFSLPLLAARAESLPVKCNAKLGFPISTSVDCGYEGN